MIDVGVIGCGYWGAKHARVCHELDSCNLRAVFDFDRSKALTITASYPEARIADDLEVLLDDDDLDAIIVATPASTHFEVALSALEAGKHVLVEKPLTIFPKDAQKLIETARRNGVTLMVGHTFEFNPAVETLKGVLESGELGKLYYLEFDRLNLGLYQRDVNVVYDLSPHDISVMTYILGERPSAVRARGYSMVHGAIVDVAYIEFVFESGLVANSRVSWLAPQKVRKTTVVGSQKMAIYDDTLDGEPIQVFEKHITPPVETEKFEDWHFAYHYGPIHSVPVSKVEPLKIQTNHFIDCILSGSAPRTSGENGLSVVCVLDAINQSISNGGTLEPVKYICPICK